MGCTYDTFHAQLASPEQARAFFRVWHEQFDPDGEHDYYGMEGERQDVYIEAEPLFRYDDQGDTIRFLVLTFLKEYPGEAFWADYGCSYSGSGEERTIEFEYDAHQLTLTHTFSDPDAMVYCQSCGKSMQQVVSDSESPDQESEYRCPDCGASSRESVYNVRSAYNLKLEGSEWQFPKGMSMPTLDNVLYHHIKEELPFSNKESDELINALQGFMLDP